MYIMSVEMCRLEIEIKNIFKAFNATVIKARNKINKM